MLKVIGGEQEGEFKAVASGTLPNGKPVVVNADGTVSVVSGSTKDEEFGSPALFESAAVSYLDSTFDSTSNKFIIAYQDSGNFQKGTAVVGTVNASNNSISFGTPVVFQNSGVEYCSIVYDSSNDKIVIFYHDFGSTNYGKAIVGTVSGTSISFGTAVVFASVVARTNMAVFDSGNGKVVNFYRNSSANNTGDAIVGTVSGTSISFGSSSNWSGQNDGNCATSYIGSSKIFVNYRKGSDNAKGYALIATVSGTSLSYGSEYKYTDDDSTDQFTSYDSTADKVLVGWRNNSDEGKVAVATVSGTAITYGSTVIYASVASSGDTSRTSATYDSVNDKTVVFYQDNGNSLYGTAAVGTISGTSISFGTPIVFEAASTNYITSSFDSNSEKIVVGYRDQGNSNYGRGIVFQNYNLTTNLTAENYIGMSRGVVEGQSQTVGTATVFDTDVTNQISSAYDANAQKVVIAYRDNSTNYGTAIVGTVSGTSISFGSAVVFESANTSSISMVYDSASQKVVIAYEDQANSQYGTAIVGTVSGTSISFGSPVIFNSNGVTTPISSAFDSNAGKVVIAYRDYGNSYYGTAIVGTVSGTSISFGTSVVFNTANTTTTAVTYDSTSQKVVIAYQDSGNSYYGTAIVGTVSGTSISFGSPVVFASHNVDATEIAYDSNAQKVVVAYADGDQNPAPGKAIVGTVSGSSISFGTAAVFDNTGTVNAISISFDSSANGVVIAYRDYGNSQYGTFVVGTVSDTSITFSSPTVFETSATDYTEVVYDPNQQKTVISYGNADDGISVVVQVGYENRYPVADGDNARLDIIGSVSDNQLGLTAGEKYYVQTDGTISTTAGSPSVLAGTAISATKLVVKT